MQRALSIHDDLLEEGVIRHGGRVLTTHGEGDSFFAVFGDAARAVEAATWSQQRLAEQDWPARARLQVRMALHTGTAGQDFRGPSANRCARLRACAHGGQVLLSSSTARKIRDQLSAAGLLRDLGEHRLRDLAQAERVFQLLIPGLRADFPPLRSLGALSNNLPAQLNRFIGMHSLSFAHFNMVHMTNWVLNGLPERFPKLKVIWIESGLAWVPFVMQRLDSEYMMRTSECPLLKKRPSEYMQEMYYTSQPLERSNMKLTQATFEAMHAETQLLYASDWPHWDFDAPSSITKLPFLNEQAKRNILGLNAARLFGLEVPPAKSGKRIAPQPVAVPAE